MPPSTPALIMTIRPEPGGRHSIVLSLQHDPSTRSPVISPDSYRIAAFVDAIKDYRAPVSDPRGSFSGQCPAMMLGFPAALCRHRFERSRKALSAS